MGGRDKPNRDRGPDRYEGCRERELITVKLLDPIPTELAMDSTDSVGGRVGQLQI
jgi:hypothetical protein